MSKGVIWDLTSYFNAFNSPEMQNFKQELNEQIGKLQSESAALSTLSADNMAKWEQVFLDYEPGL
ncbi:MAG: hypothetical protein M0R38_13415 [Bacteroidia bacterium]|nr:hypothetical protein [Bacteroidia bacterium]